MQFRHTGKLGADMTVEEGKLTARVAALAILATVKQEVGDLDRVRRVIRLFGMVNCTAEFKDQPMVINGFSELMKDVFGDDAGVGARSAVGQNSLPAGMAVEIEAIFEVEA